MKSNTKNLLAVGTLCCAALAAMLATPKPPPQPPTYDQEFEAFRLRREAELEEQQREIRSGASVEEIQRRRDEGNRRRQQEINAIRDRHALPPLPVPPGD